MINKEALDIKHPQVIAFAKAMDKVLCENDYKGGWDNCGIEYLRARLNEELGEYFALAAEFYQDNHWIDDSHNFELMKKELIDIANFAMMLWDRS